MSGGGNWGQNYDEDADKQQKQQEKQQKMLKLEYKMMLAQYRDIHSKYLMTENQAQQIIQQYYTQIVTSKSIGDKEKDLLKKCLEPLENFISGKNKASVCVYGSISVGKSSLLNALIGQCVLPSSSKETTETLVKLLHSQQGDKKEAQIFPENSQYLICNSIPNIHQFLFDQNESIRQQNLDSQKFIVKANFNSLDAFEKKMIFKNKLLEDSKIYFMDVPGCDSTKEGKDARVSNSISDSESYPRIVMYITTPESIDKQSTKNFLSEFQKIQKEKILNEQLIQNKFYELINLLMPEGSTQNNKPENLDPDQLIRSKILLVVNKKDGLEIGEDDFIHRYDSQVSGQPILVSSKQELQWNVLKYFPSQHNITFLLRDEQLRNSAMKVLGSKELAQKLQKISPEQWPANAIERVVVYRNKIFDDIFPYAAEDSEESGFNILVLKLLYKITFECQQFLDQQCRKYQFVSSSLQLDFTAEILTFINGSDYDKYQKSKKIVIDSLKKEIFDMNQARKQIGLVSMQAIDQLFKSLIELFDLSLHNVENLSKAKMEENVKSKFYDPLEKQLIEIQNQHKNNIQKTTNNIKQMFSSKHFPFLHDKVIKKIETMFQALTFAQNQAMTLNNHFDDFDFLSKSLKIMVACLIGELAAIAGIIAVETAAAATAWFGVGLVLGAIGAVVGGITIYKLKTKSKQFNAQCEDIKNQLKDTLNSQLKQIYEKNEEILRTTTERIFECLDNGYKKKIQL